MEHHPQPPATMAWDGPRKADSPRERDVRCPGKQDVPALLHRRSRLQRRIVGPAHRPGLAGPADRWWGCRTRHHHRSAVPAVPAALPVGGMLADRFPKRKILMCTQVANLTLAAFLGALTVSGHVVTWHVYVLALPVRCLRCARLAGPAELRGRDGRQGQRRERHRPQLGVVQRGQARGPGLAGLLLVSHGHRADDRSSTPLTYAGLFIALQLIRAAGPLTRRADRPDEGRVQGRHRLHPRAQRPRPGHGHVGFVAAFGLNMQMTSRADGHRGLRQGCGRVRRARLDRRHRHAGRCAGGRASAACRGCG